MKITSALDLHNSISFSRPPDAWPNATSQPATAIPRPDFGLAPSSGSDSDSSGHPRSSTAGLTQGPGEYPLVAIVGPTASGKSSLALSLAQSLNGEIINYDSVQVFCEMDVGSGKLRPAERLGIPHHLLDIAQPGRVFTAGHYRRLALEALEGVKKRGRLPIFVGGTGLYLRALLHGLFEGPARSEQLRAKLRAAADRRGKAFLHRLLTRLDPPSAAHVHPHDSQKIIRALEVCFLARQPLSRLQARGRRGLAGFRVFKVGLEPERRALYRRIDRRTEWMFASGLIEEARALLEKYGDPGPFTALGYRQAQAVVRGGFSLQEAVQETQAETRHYAKRQLTWFRREEEVTWFMGFGDDPDIQREVLQLLHRTLPARVEEVRRMGSTKNLAKGNA